MADSFSTSNIFLYVTFTMIFCFVSIFIPVATTSVLLGLAGLVWLWRRHDLPHSNKKEGADSWSSIHEKLDRNTIKVQSLSQLQQDRTEQHLRQLDQMQQDYDALALKFDDYRKTHDHTQEVDALQQQLATLQQEDDTSKKTIYDLRQQEENLRREHKDLQHRLHATELDNNELKDKLTIMEGTKNEQQDGMQQQVIELQRIKDSNEQQLAALKNNTIKLEETIKTLRVDTESTRTALEQHTHELTQQLATANDQINALRQETESLEARLDAATQQKDATTADFERQIDTLTQQVALVEQDKKGAIDALEQQIGTLQHDKDTGSEALAKELETIKETAEREKHELQDHLNNEKRKTEDLHLFVRENNKELHRVAADALNYQQQVEEMKAQLEQQQDQCADMEQQINELNVDVHQKGLELIDRQRNEDRLLEELTHVGQKLEHEKDLESLMDQIQHLMADIEMLKNEKAALALELGNLEAKRNRADQELNGKTKIGKKSWAHHSSDEGFWQPRFRHSGTDISPHRNTHFPPLKASRSSSIPRLSTTNMSLSRSKSSRLPTKSGGQAASADLYQMIRRQEDVILELQRQLDDSLAQLDDREQRLCELLANTT